MIGLVSKPMSVVVSGLAVSWTSFVVAFLYYTALTALVLGGVSPVWTLLAGAYLGPVLAYGLALTWRFLTGLLAHSRRPARAQSSRTARDRLTTDAMNTHNAIVA